MPETPVSSTLDGSTATITMDDGKTNTMSETMLQALGTPSIVRKPIKPWCC